MQTTYHFILSKKIFLIGFMGSGKTHWGRVWSAAYNLSFVDLDALIEKEQRKSISTIFEESGENMFREVEAEALRSFESENNCIIACGGGTPCFHKNMEWMNANGITIYLKTPIELLEQRLAYGKNHRPVLNNIDESGLKKFIQQRLSEREHFYNKAKIILDAETINDDTFLKILSAV